jgi:AraC-like DNA-binding protein
MRREGALQHVPLPLALPSDLPAVLACAVTSVQRSRLIDALRGRATLGYCATFAELSTVLHHSTDPIDVIVLPACDAAGQDASRIVREIAVGRPRTATVVWCDAHHSVEIRALAVAGAHQFLFAGIDDQGVALRAVLDLARRQCGAEWVMTRLAPVVPSGLHPMLEAVLARPDAIKTLPDLAAALGVHRKTLFNHCRKAGFLAPAELVAWARLAMVAYMLETTACTIERIAIDLGYASDTALRNTIKRYTGQRAGQIRNAGGVDRVIRELDERARRGVEATRLRLV